MRIAFVWTEFSSYMADCWKALNARPGVEVRVWLEVRRNGNVEFNPEKLMGDVKFGWDYSDQITDIECRQAEQEIVAFRPDVIFVCGWAREVPPFVAKSAKLAEVPKVLCCDMPWEWKLRKFAARLVLWRQLRRFKKILVPGARAARYARWLGFGTADVVRGEYAIDVDRFGSVASNGERSGFVFVGRLVSDKNIRLLASAYRKYRMLGGKWGLDVYGNGTEKRWFDGIEGVRVNGFVQPEGLPGILARAGAFVLASKWDPWPLVLLESCAAGLPIICTRNCWNRYELVKGNGLVVPSGSVDALARAMLAVSSGEKKLDGAGGRPLAAEYSCAKWCDRIMKLVDEI